MIETTSFRVDAAPSIDQHGQVGLRLAMTVAGIVSLTWPAGRPLLRYCSFAPRNPACVSGTPFVGSPGLDTMKLDGSVHRK